MNKLTPGARPSRQGLLKPGSKPMLPKENKDLEAPQVQPELVAANEFDAEPVWSPVPLDTPDPGVQFELDAAKTPDPGWLELPDPFEKIPPAESPSAGWEPFPAPAPEVGTPESAPLWDAVLDDPFREKPVAQGDAPAWVWESDPARAEPLFPDAKAEEPPAPWDMPGETQQGTTLVADFPSTLEGSWETPSTLFEELPETAPAANSLFEDQPTAEAPPLFGDLPASEAAPLFGDLPESAAPLFGNLPESAATPLFGDLPESAAAPLFGDLLESAAAPLFGDLPESAAPLFGDLPESAAAPLFGDLPESAAAPLFGDLPESAAAPLFPESAPETVWDAPVGESLFLEVAPVEAPSWTWEPVAPAAAEPESIFADTPPFDLLQPETTPLPLVLEVVRPEAVSPWESALPTESVTLEGDAIFGTAPPEVERSPWARLKPASPAPHTPSEPLWGTTSETASQAPAAPLEVAWNPVVERELAHPESEVQVQANPALEEELQEMVEADMAVSPPPAEPTDFCLGRPHSSLSIEDESPSSHVEQARLLREQNQGADVAARIRVYRKAIEETPDNLVLRADLADLHLRYGLLDDAVVQYRQLVKRNPQSVGLHHRLVEAYLWNENPQEAALALMELASLHGERAEAPDAVDALQTVLSLEPDHFAARRVLVERCQTLQQPKLATHHLRQLAEGALTKGQWHESIQAFQELLEFSQDPALRDRLAQVYENQGDTALALSHLVELTRHYREHSRWEEAAAAGERILALAPQSGETRGELIEIYRTLGWSEKAVGHKFQLALEMTSLGHREQATILLNQVVQEQPSHHEARRQLLEAHLAAGRCQEATPHAQLLAQHHLENQRPDLACALYAGLVEASPDDLALRHNLIAFAEQAQDGELLSRHWRFLADHHVGRENWPLAIQAYQGMLAQNEAQAEIHHALARIYLDRVSNLALALDEYQRVCQLEPSQGEPALEDMRLLLKVGKAPAAAGVLLELRKHNPQAKDYQATLLEEYRVRIEAEPSDLSARFSYGELCYHLGELDQAIEQFQRTRRDSGYELRSYNMLGLCFAEKKSVNMLELAIRQFRKGLETPGSEERDYLELRYNLAMLQYRHGRLHEALQELKDCYAVDIAYRDVRDWMRRVEAEIAGGPKLRLLPRAE